MFQSKFFICSFLWLKFSFQRLNLDQQFMMFNSQILLFQLQSWVEVSYLLLKLDNLCILLRHGFLIVIHHLILVVMLPLDFSDFILRRLSFILFLPQIVLILLYLCTYWSIFHLNRIPFSSQFINLLFELLIFRVHLLVLNHMLVDDLVLLFHHQLKFCVQWASLLCFVMSSIFLKWDFLILAFDLLQFNPQWFDHFDLLIQLFNFFLSFEQTSLVLTVAAFCLILLQL